MSCFFSCLLTNNNCHILIQLPVFTRIDKATYWKFKTIPSILCVLLTDTQQNIELFRFSQLWKFKPSHTTNFPYIEYDRFRAKYKRRTFCTLRIENKSASLSICFLLKPRITEDIFSNWFYSKHCIGIIWKEMVCKTNS